MRLALIARQKESDVLTEFPLTHPGGLLEFKHVPGEAEPPQIHTPIPQNSHKQQGFQL